MTIATSSMEGFMNGTSNSPDIRPNISLPNNSTKRHWWDDTPTKFRDCSNAITVIDFNKNYFLIPYAICCFLSVLMILIGTKHIKISNFIVAAIFSGIISYVVIYNHLSHNLEFIAAGIGIGICVGAICLVNVIGNAIVCFFSGAIIGLFLTFAIRFAVEFPYFWIGTVVCASSGIISLIGSTFNSRAYRNFAMFNCCSFVILATIDYILNGKSLTIFAIQVMTSSPIYNPPCWTSWLYILAWVIPIILGYIFMAICIGIDKKKRGYRVKHKGNVKYFQNLIKDNNHDSKIL